MTSAAPTRYISRTSDTFPNFQPKTEVATVLIEWNGRYLFLERSKKEDQGERWGIPGGKREDTDTTIRATLARELFEETGWRVAPEQFHFRAKLYGRVPNWDYILHVFHLSLYENPPEILLSAEEHTKSKWVTVEEINDLFLVKGQDTVLAEVNLKDDHNIGRIHVSVLPKKIDAIATEMFEKYVKPNNRRIIINLIGTTGIGKGTQGEFLQKKYNWAHVSIGDLFRDELRNKTDLGAQIEHHDERTNTSRYNPDEITLGIMAKRLSDADCRNGFILDGFPRTGGQSKTLINTFLRPDDLHIPIWMKIDDTHIYDRVTGRFICSDCGTQVRSHDKQEKPGFCPDCDVPLVRRAEDASIQKVTKRLQIFSDNIDAVADHLLERDDIYVLYLDNSHSPDEVFKAIDQIVQKKLTEAGIHESRL